LLIHIVTSNKSVPVKAFFDKDSAKEFYEMMRDDKTLPHCSFGLISMAIEDASQPIIELDAGKEARCPECGTTDKYPPQPIKCKE